MNIIISGWPGAGSSTLAMILSFKLKFKLIRGSESFRYLGEKLGFSDLGKDRVEVDSMLEKHWGKIYDKFIDYSILNKSSQVIESDIGAFRVGKGDTHISIFLAPSIEERKNRLIVDGREKDVNELVNRELELQKSYMDLHGIDWLDINEVNKHYDIVITDSNIKISDELKKVYTLLKSLNHLDNDTYTRFTNESISDEKYYWEKGKSFFLELLKENNLLTTGAEVLKESKRLFPDEISDMPQQLKAVIEDVT